MEIDELMIVESTSSLHLTVSEEEESTPALSKLSSSSSSSTSSSYEDESTEDHESSLKMSGDSSSFLCKINNTTDNNSSVEQMGSGESKKQELKEDSQCSIPVVEEEENDSKKEGTEEEEPQSKTETPPPPQLEILNSEEQADGSLHIEIKDDGCGDPEEGASAKIQRLARKAGIIVGGGTMTAVGTVMLFLPCPTPSIYLMIGGMAIMSKEIPAAQRQLDETRGSLQGWVERAEKEFAESVRKINVVVDNGSPKNSDQKDKKEKKEEDVEKEDEEKKTPTSPTAITSTQVVHQQHNPVKRHFVKSCRNVILPLLNKVCTPQELLQDGVVEEESTTTTEASSPAATAPEAIPEEPVKTPRSPESASEGKENTSPVSSPFARWAQYRQNRREELLKAEEQREREAMLARINEANLKKLQDEKEVVEENRDEEEEEEEDEEPPVLSESLQRLLSQSESAVIRV